MHFTDEFIDFDLKFLNMNQFKLNVSNHFEQIQLHILRFEKIVRVQPIPKNILKLIFLFSITLSSFNLEIPALFWLYKWGKNYFHLDWFPFGQTMSVKVHFSHLHSIKIVDVFCLATTKLWQIHFIFVWIFPWKGAMVYETTIVRLIFCWQNSNEIRR